MGLKIKDLINVFETYNNLKFAEESKIYIDTSIYMYKYLHVYKENWINGFFNQVSQFRKFNITPVYILDSKPPLEKEKLLKTRKESRKEDSIRVTPEIIKDFRDYMEEEKISVLDSPDYCDAEKYCCKLSLENEQDEIKTYVMSNDYDTILYGAKNIIRSISSSYQVLEPEKLFEDLELNQDQFLEMCICIGTDFNPGGIKGYGPKTCLKILKRGDKLPLGEFEYIKDLFKLNESKVTV